MNVLLSIWSYFAVNILQQPAFFIGLMVIIGSALLKKPFHEIVSSFIKAVTGYMILSVGAGGLVSKSRPILVGLRDKFDLNAVIIDPYYGQSAINTDTRSDWQIVYTGYVAAVNCICL